MGAVHLWLVCARTAENGSVLAGLAVFPRLPGLCTGSQPARARDERCTNLSPYTQDEGLLKRVVAVKV